MDILKEILSRKRERLRTAKSVLPIGELRRRLKDADKTRDFKGAIRRDTGRIRLIAEIKKASPSRGVLRGDLDPVRIASLYEEKPVSAISVLTEEDFFQGHLSFVRKVKEVTSKPILRKDFVIDEYQVYESRFNGADALLLIAAALGKNQVQEYLHLAREIGMSVLFEAHDEDDLEKAFLAGADIIGINNRNLKTLAVHLETTVRLRKSIPKNTVVVSESGIKDRNDVIRLEEAGVDAVLVGTVLMQARDIGGKIDELMTPVSSHQ